MTDVSIQDRQKHSTGTLKAVIYTNPEAALFRGAVRGENTADICGDCGHMDLRVVSPQELYRQWKATH